MTSTDSTRRAKAELPVQLVANLSDIARLIGQHVDCSCPTDSPSMTYAKRRSATAAILEQLCEAAKSGKDVDTLFALADRLAAEHAHLESVDLLQRTCRRLFARA